MVGAGAVKHLEGNPLLRFQVPRLRHLQVQVGEVPVTAAWARDPQNLWHQVGRQSLISDQFPDARPMHAGMTPPHRLSVCAYPRGVL